MDTGYLIAAELKEHPGHAFARNQLLQLVKAGDTFALAPQVLAEFIHVVTDPRRFTNPLAIEEARRLAQRWWTSADITQVFPDTAAMTKFFEWHEHFNLGRKRLLDTLLAATYWRAGALSILTTNQTILQFSACSPASYRAPATQTRHNDRRGCPASTSRARNY